LQNPMEWFRLPPAVEHGFKRRLYPLGTGYRAT
jgi:hypothetical protein